LQTKADVLSQMIIFSAQTIYRWCNVPFSSGDKALIKNLYLFKNTVFGEYWKKF